jgi:protein-S-isoprenylcysteine O-methyltransferase Ste14
MPKARSVTRSFRGKIPLTFSSVLFVFVLLAGVLRVCNDAGAQTLLAASAVAVYLAWLLAESWLVSVREVSLPETRSDRGSCEMYAIAQGLTVIGALLLPSTGFARLESAGGLLLLVAGCAFRLSAIVTLGRFYSRRVRLLEGHRVVSAGPYRLVRHPAYVGTLVAHLGFVLIFGHWIPLLCWAVLFVPMVVRRIRVEEPVLFELHGYDAYASGRKRLLPLVW